MKKDDENLLSLATLGFFAFSLVHNLANQFTQLLFYVEEASTYLPRPMQQRLSSTTWYLASIVRDSQALLHHESPSCELWFDLQTCVKEALALSEYEIRRQGITITTQIFPLEIMGNRVILLQILLNILKNGLQALQSSPQKQLTLTLQESTQYWILQIIDTGPGFSSRIRPLESTRTDSHGLGLVYCQHHMERSFSGKCLLENAPDSTGCICSLFFPKSLCIQKIRQEGKSPVE